MINLVEHHLQFITEEILSFYASYNLVGGKGATFRLSSI